MRQQGSKYFVRRLLPDPHPLPLGSKLNFSEYSHVAYRIKEYHKCSNMVANVLTQTPLPHLPTLGMKSIGKDSTFSEQGHVAYQIKENHECTNMVANIFARRSSSPPLRIGSVCQTSTFSEYGHVAFQT